MKNVAVPHNASLRIGMTAQKCDKLEYIKNRYAWAVSFVRLLSRYRKTCRPLYLLSVIKKLAASEIPEDWVLNNTSYSVKETKDRATFLFVYRTFVQHSIYVNLQWEKRTTEHLRNNNIITKNSLLVTHTRYQDLSITDCSVRGGIYRIIGHLNNLQMAEADKNRFLCRIFLILASTGKKSFWSASKRY